MPHQYKRSPSWWNYYVRANYHKVADLDLPFGDKIRQLAQMARDEHVRPRRIMISNVARLLNRVKYVPSHCRGLARENCDDIPNCFMTRGKLRSPYCRKNKKWIGPLSQDQEEAIAYHEAMKVLKRQKKAGMR